MYAIAFSWTSWGIPEPTVGLVFGTGRSGMGTACAFGASASWGVGVLAVGWAVALALALAMLDALDALDGVGAGAFFGSSHDSKRTVSVAQPSIRAMVLRLARSLGRPVAAKPKDVRWLPPRPFLVPLVTLVTLVRPVTLVALVMSIVIGGPTPARGAESPPPANPGLAVVAQCDRASEPGRVRCGVDVRPPPGESLVWADVVVVRVPGFSAPLRGRVGPLEATAKDPTGYRFALALVARATGKGELALRVRAVVCAEKSEKAEKAGCRAIEAEPVSEVTVGG